MVDACETKQGRWERFWTRERGERDFWVLFFRAALLCYRIPRWYLFYKPRWYLRKLYLPLGPWLRDKWEWFFLGRVRTPHDRRVCKCPSHKLSAWRPWHRAIRMRRTMRELNPVVEYRRSIGAKIPWYWILGRALRTK